MYYDLKKKRQKIEEVQSLIEEKRIQQENLNTARKHLMEGIDSLQQVHIDQVVQDRIGDALKTIIDEVDTQGKVQADELVHEMDIIGQFQKDLNTALMERDEIKNNLMSKKQFLETLGMKKFIDDSVEEINDNNREKELFCQELMKIGNELCQVLLELKSLGSKNRFDEVKWEHAFDHVPKHRVETVRSAFVDAPDNIINLINEYSSQVRVERTRIRLDDAGHEILEPSHFSEDEGIRLIRMDERKDDEEYAIVFRHEFGHFIDASLQRPSLQEDFTRALEKDCKLYDCSLPEGAENFEYLLKELRKSQAFKADNQYVSDILSGLFHNDKRIVSIYYDDYRAFYHHENVYWDGLEGPSKAVQRETFANLFALYTENDKEVIKFVEKSFPNITTHFKIQLRGEIDE